MDSCHTAIGTDSCQRYKNYDRIMGNISWLLIALVALGIKLMPAEEANTLMLVLFCILLFFYNMVARYGLFSRHYNQFTSFVDIMVFLAFIVAVCWHTGKLTSPFMSLIFLVLMAAALTQGRRITYLMAGLAIVADLLLAAADPHETGYYLTHLLELFPYLLIAHLGAMLAGETESARRDVERLSLTDEVTGLNNMRNFTLLADAQEKLAQRYKRSFAICMIDADGLKKINDQYGHLAGTELIRRVGEVITSNIRCSDICARYGGDEFVILFNETTKLEVAVAVERIVNHMADTPFLFEGTSLTSTLSAGLAEYPADGEDVRSVMANADEAMYVSKRSGKNRLTIFDAGLRAMESAS